MGGLRGFPFGMVRAQPFSGVLGAWRLNDFVSVRLLQARYNLDRRTSQTAHSSDSTVPYITTGAITEDGKWGPNTMTAFKAWIDYHVRSGHCTETSGSEFERNGPRASAACLDSQGFGSNVDELQIAWQEYKDEKARQDRLARSAPVTSTTDGTVTVTPVPPEEEGMSTGTKVAIGIVVALLLLGGYYVLTD